MTGRTWIGLVVLSCALAACGDDAAPDTDLQELYEADSEARVDSQLSCTDIRTGVQLAQAGAVSMSALLPRSLLLALADPGDAPRNTAAQTYAHAVMERAWDQRLAELIDLHDTQMTRDEYRGLVEQVWTTDTLLPLAELEPLIDDYCDATSAAVTYPLGPSGYACPLAPTPDCAADAPPMPWGCPPAETEPCPDCPGLAEAEAELARLQELFEAARAAEQLDGVVDAITDAILDAIESGDIPDVGDLVQGIVTSLLGPDYPGIALYIELVSSTVEGLTVGGPLGGLAMFTWALVTGWGDFADGEARLQALLDAQRRVDALRAWCEELMWADMQEKCEETRAWILELRTAECVEAEASYQAQRSAWEADQDACDDEREMVAAANEAAKSMTGRLQGGPYAFTQEAFELCCDMPVGAPRCPPENSGIDPVPYPPWAKPRGYGLLSTVTGGVKRIDPGGDLSAAPLWSSGIAMAGALGAHTARDELLLGGRAAVYDIRDGGDQTSAFAWATFDTGTVITGVDYLPVSRVWAFTDVAGGEVWLAAAPTDFTGGTAFATGLDAPVSVIQRADGTVLAAENGGDRIVDITAGGDFTSAPSYRDLPAAPQHLTDCDGVLLVSTATPTGTDSAVYDLGPATPALLVHGIFNPSGMACNPTTGQTLVSSFAGAGAGACYDLTGLAPGTDLTSATPYATGLSNPNGLTWFLFPAPP